MDENSCQTLLPRKCSNTTDPYMQRAKELIIRGLLTRGTDARLVNDNQELIGGSYRTTSGISQGRVFLVKEKMATLLWVGPSKEFRTPWMKIRDERAGNVPDRLYGSPASAQNTDAITTGPTVKTRKALTCENATSADTKISMDKFTEKDIENIYAKYHELIEPELKLLARQKNVAGKRH